MPTSPIPVSPLSTPVNPPGLSRSHHRLSRGDMLAEYRIEHSLGRGGMGVVYAAWDTVADRPVAVKVLGGPIADPQMLARFRREAALATRIHHPGVVAVYGVGQTPDVCFLVMQRVEGVTLRDWFLSHGSQSTGTQTSVIADKNSGSVESLDPDQPTERFSIRFDPETADSSVEIDLPEPPAWNVAVADPVYVSRVANMLRELADALAHAHQAGITHRDLKPENVMVREDGRVVLIDFGLARAFTDTTLTSHNGLIGTPLYMSPEQLAGKPASQQSDVYALGLMGYELLAGALPFKGGSVERLLGEVLHKPIPPLDARNDLVPPGLANIIHKATAKKPEERYVSALELRDDLYRHLANERVTACHYQYRFNNREWIATRPTSMSLAAYCVALLGGLISLYGLFSASMKSDLTSLTPSVAGIVFLVVARWMFAGRWGARVLGYMVACLLLMSGAWLLWSAFSPDVQKVPLLIIVTLVMVPTINAIVLFLALTRRSTADWLKLVQSARSEFQAEGRNRK